MTLTICFCKGAETYERKTDLYKSVGIQEENFATADIVIGGTVMLGVAYVCCRAVKTGVTIICTGGALYGIGRYVILLYTFNTNQGTLNGFEYYPEETDTIVEKVTSELNQTLPKNIKNGAKEFSCGLVLGVEEEILHKELLY